MHKQQVLPSAVSSVFLLPYPELRLLPATAQPLSQPLQKAQGSPVILSPLVGPPLDYSHGCNRGMTGVPVLVLTLAAQLQTQTTLAALDFC